MSTPPPPSSPETKPLRVGIAKRDVTCLVAGIGMYGWAMHHNKARRIQMPLMARTFVFADPATGVRLTYVYAELAFMTLSVRTAVLARLAAQAPELGVTEENLMLAANHTHSTPGGYSHYPLFNITVGGFNAQVLETIVNGITESIIEAHGNLQPASLHTASGDFAPDIPVAFNRSWQAHSANPDTENYDEAHWHLAVDRTMHLLRIEGEAGRKIGQINWFAVHTTTVHSDKDTISPDNKGWAAHQFEEYINTLQPDAPFLAAFPQAGTGDVTPNFQRRPGEKEMRGAGKDDYESMRINGDFQAEKAKELYKAAILNRAEPPVLDALTWYVDMTQIECDPKFTNGRKGCRTGKSILGVRFMHGTREGEGIHGILPWFVMTLGAKIRKQQPNYEAIHGSKNPVTNNTDRFVFGFPADKIGVPSFLSPEVAVLKRWGAAGAFRGTQPLTPNILPVQIFILGTLAIAALPTEPTTQVARRARAAVLEVLKDRGVTNVILAGYTNAYSGYTTTQEEYQVQAYEGGSTHFGQWTCAAYQTVLYQMAQEMLKPVDQRRRETGLTPHTFTPAQLEAMKWQEAK